MAYGTRVVLATVVSTFIYIYYNCMFIYCLKHLEGKADELCKKAQFFSTAGLHAAAVLFHADLAG